MKQVHEDVDVTDMTKKEREEVRRKMVNRKGFINFATGWTKQYTPNERMWYIFWYEVDESHE